MTRGIDRIVQYLVEGRRIDRKDFVRIQKRKT